MTHFDQAYIINERNIKDATSCRGRCEDITHSSFDNFNDQSYTTDDQRQCNNFYDCQSTASEVYLCSSDEDSDYFYEHIRIGGDPLNYCFQGELFVGRQKGNCEMCLCYCDDPSARSDRIVSLQEHVSDVAANEVITGMRVVKIAQIFYLQIQVGKLIPMMKVDQNSTRWVPVKKIPRIVDYSVNSRDYFILRRNSHFDMDVLTLNENEVLTGNSIICIQT